MNEGKQPGPEVPRGGELRQLRRRVRELERELEACQQELRLLYTSNSFRLTAPLRWVRRRLSGSAALADSTVGSPVVDEPALAGFPLHIRARGGAAPNDSHRPLDLDAAIAPLLAVPVRDGGLVDGLAPGATRYLGSRAAPLRVATLASRELREELSFDAATTPLQAAEWSDQLEPGSQDLLLIEPAWEPEGGWGVAFADTSEARMRLRNMLALARRHGIPSVLWARDEVAGLARVGWLATEVDRVYAVDREGLAWFRRELPHIDCRLLPVAVQPALYNPVRSYALNDCREALAGKVLYDGWWDLGLQRGADEVTAAFEERLRVLDSSSDYSRARLSDSPPHAKLALGAVTPLEKSALLRNMAAEVFVPNTLAPSWRQATRMVRAAASGAGVFWAGKPDELPVERDVAAIQPIQAAGAAATLEAWVGNPLESSQQVHAAWREVFTRHCLADRLQQMADDLGLGRRVVEEPVRVAHLLVTMRPELLATCLERFRTDLYPNRELVVVLHGDGVNLGHARRMLAPGEQITILTASRERSLGDCLHLALAHTDAPYWMKLDDDDHYGPSYTSDMMLYRRAIDAPLMGKPPVFLHLEDGDELRWDPVWARHANLLHSADEADAALVAGGTLAGKREVLESVGFATRRRGGSDSEFIRECHRQGHDLLAVDGFNFARFRSAEQGFHTWNVPASALSRRTRRIGTSSQLRKWVYL